MDRHRVVAISTRVLLCVALLGIVGPAAEAAGATSHAPGTPTYLQQGARMAGHHVPADECDGTMMRNAGLSPHM